MVGNDGLADGLASAWREHWPYFKLSVAIFFVGSIIGALLVMMEVDLLAIIGIDDLGEAFPEEITTLTILINNTVVFVLALVGVFSFGLLTAVILLFNGVLVGYVVLPAAEEVGIGFVAVAILPHGILELPAFFVASAVAFRLIHRFILRIRDRRDRMLDPGDLRRMALLLAVAWVVLAVAAAVEAIVTVWLIEALYPELAPDAG